MPTTPAAIDLSKFRREEILRDGYRVLLRPIEKSDVPLWLGFISRLSTHSLYLRFHYIPKGMTEEDALHYCTVDYKNSFAYVAEVGYGKDRKIIAITRYYRLPNKRSAEVAFAIEDAYQNIGLGTKLIQGLADVARENDITVFEADVLGENRQMMIAFKDYGFHITSSMEGGVYHVTFPHKTDNYRR